MNSKTTVLANTVLALAVVGAAGMLWMCLEWNRKPSANPPPKETPRRELVQNAGRWYRNGDTNPFTGLMVDYYPGGALCSRMQISNGVLNGISEAWYTNGEMQVRENFKNGISNGLREKWHENGSRLSEARVVEGKVTGTFRSWHDNGQLSEKIEMKFGHPDGVALAYYPSGFLKAETTVQDGKVLERKTWKDGDQSAVASP